MVCPLGWFGSSSECRCDCFQVSRGNDSIGVDAAADVVAVVEIKADLKVILSLPFRFELLNNQLLGCPDSHANAIFVGVRWNVEFLKSLAVFSLVFRFGENGEGEIYFARTP